MKIVLGLVAVPVVALSGAFAHRMYLETTAPEDLSLATASKPEVVEQLIAPPVQSEQSVQPKAAEVAQEIQEEKRALAATEHHVKEPAQEATELVKAPLVVLMVPSDLNAKSAQTWIFTSGLIGLEDGSLIEDRALFQTLDGLDAARVHAALLAGGASFEALRIHFFALCGELPALKRREFASATGAVFQGADQAFAEVHMGDFTRLLFLQTGDSASTYARAVRDFSAVLTDVEMIHALTDLGVVEAKGGADGWSTHVGEKMGDFDPGTLMAIRAAIQDEKFGDRKLLREYIGALSEQKKQSTKAPLEKLDGKPVGMSNH